MNGNGIAGKTKRTGYLNVRACRIALAYAVFAMLWIYFSDHALQFLNLSPDQLVSVSLYKGLAFVGVTFVLLLILLSRSFGTIETGYRALQVTELARQAHEAEIERLNRLYSALSHINQAIVWSTTRDALLKKVCEVLVEYGKFRLAWIGMEDSETRRLIPVAECGDENDYLKSIVIPTADDRPEGRGPTGTAFREDRAYVCNDLQADEATLLWRAELTRRGFRASAAFPIHEQGRVCGTLSVYYHEVGFFKEMEIALLEEAAVDISFALENLRREELQKEAETIARSEKQFSDSMIESMPGILFLHDDEGHLLRWNRNLELITGRSVLELLRTPPAELIPDWNNMRIEKPFSDEEPGSGNLIEASLITRTGGSQPYFFTRTRIDFNGRPCFLTLGIDASEKHRAEEFQNRLVAIVNSSEDAIIGKSLAGTITSWNPGAEKLFGYSSLEAVGRKMLMVFPPELEDEEREILEKIGKGESVLHFETQRIRKDGRRIDVSVTLSPISDAAGRIIGVSKVARDITERKAAEEALRASEERYRTTLDSMMEGAQLLGYDWRYLYLNDAASVHNRRPNSELIGKTLFESWPGIESSKAFLPLDKCMVERVADHHETEFVFPDGTSGWFDVRCHPVPEGIFILSIDITARKLVENHLRDSEQRFRQLADNVNEVFWLTDPSKNAILYVSPAYEKIWGRTCVELHEYPRIWMDAVHEDDRERVVRAALTRQTSGDYDEIYRIIRPDGGIRWIHDRAFPITNEKDEVYRVAGTAEDITASKLAEIELARSNRALRMLSECCEALTRISDENQLLTEVCRLAVETGGYRMAWVGYAAEDEGKSIFPMAHAGEENGYLREIKLSWSEGGSISQGPGGTTIREARAVVCEDIAVESTVFYWRKEALRHGYRSVICLPLSDGNRTFGLLSLHSGEVNEAGGDEIKLLQNMADDLAFGICNIRLQNERRRMQAAVLKVAASVSASADDRFFTQLTVNMVDALGAQAGFISRLLPDEHHSARTIAAVAGGKPVDNFEYDLTGTPCAQLQAGHDPFVVTERMVADFPNIPQFAKIEPQAYVGRRLLNSSGRTVGMIVVLFKDKLKDSDFVSSTLRIFATRAAAELDRLDADARILEQASLLDKAQDAIIVRGLDHRILYWNRSAERFYGWTAEEAVGCQINELIYQDDGPFLSATRMAVEKGEWLGEIEQITKDGRTKIVEGRWSLVHDDDGNPKSILAINTDITERKQLEQQFLRAQRMESIGTLAGGIAHDLNNVLAPIMMSIDLLRTYVNNPNGLEILSLVGASARRGAEMVSQVLTFARGVEGRSVDVHISHIIKDLIRIIEDTFPKNIRIVHFLQPDLWFVKGDPTQIHQVLLNLCVNSRDAMPEGGWIRINVENIIVDSQYAGMNIEASPGPYLKIEVEDSGHGIPREIIDKLFDPFFTTKEVGKGTGLGLSTSLAIIKSHGGFIRAYSDPGMGAKFRIYLPADTHFCTDSLERPEAALPRGNGETILVVDDEASIRQVTKQTLEAFGYKVLLACDGSEAVSVYVTQQAEIALVLTDMMMPVMDGPATIQVLRRLAPELKIIGASGISANGKVAKAANAGLNHFLPKPYTAETLLNAIHALLAE